MHEPGPVLRGERVLLRPATADDVDGLLAILAEPAVARWWGDYDAAGVLEDMPGSFAIVVDGALAGWLLVDEETNPDYPSVGLDIMLTSGLHGRGYGPEALRVAIRHFVERGHHRFTIDPAAENERAQRSFASVGFKPVGVMRSCERSPDGTWRDGLLMDLLAGELVD